MMFATSPTTALYETDHIFMYSTTAERGCSPHGDDELLFLVCSCLYFVHIIGLSSK